MQVVLLGNSWAAARVSPPRIVETASTFFTLFEKSLLREGVGQAGKPKRGSGLRILDPVFYSRKKAFLYHGKVLLRGLSFSWSVARPESMKIKLGERAARLSKLLAIGFVCASHKGKSQTIVKIA
jgi:hypothetical protein